MSNIIQIKSGASPPPDGTLEDFELGYVTNDGCLYIGKNGGTTPVKVQAAESLVSNWGSFLIEEDVFLLEYGQPVLEFLYGRSLRITAPVNRSGEILLSETTIELIDPGAGRAAIKITPGFTKIIDNQNNDRLVVGWNGTTTIMNQQYGGITISNDYIELVDGWGGGIAVESGNLRFNGNTYFNDVKIDLSNVFMQKAISAGTGFDSLYGSDTIGLYRLVSSGGYLNTATSDRTGILLVFPSGQGTAAQMHISTNGSMWIRGRSASTWSAWRSVTTTVV